MDSIERLGDLYMKPGMTIDRYETEKKSSLCGQIYVNVYIFTVELIWNSYRGRFYIGIDFKFSTRYDLLCACL